MAYIHNAEKNTKKSIYGQRYFILDDILLLNLLITCYQNT